MLSKFSEEAQKVLINAKKEMQELKHPYVGSEHLFLSLLKINKEFSNRFKDLGITYSKFKNKLIEMVGIGSSENNWFLYTPLLKNIIEAALLISKESTNSEVTSSHLIYALFEEGEGVAIRVLNSFDINIDDIEHDYSKILTTKRKKQSKKLIVEEFGVDLTKKALNNELDPVIGRDKEIKRMMEILCRRSKNNPLLIGEAGVGKTALVEELARMIVSKQVPNKLKNKRIISLSLAALVSGTKYRGEFEERIIKMLKEVEEADDIFLFIDEIHTIMGAGGAEGAIDAANIFKPALSRGKIRLIGATTINEYKQTIEKDKAMERRFQTVFINEPDNLETYKILKEISPIYEEYHNVKISDELIRKIIELSNRYLYDRCQPDKSIDILDEVCSKVALNNNKVFNKLDLYNEQLIEVRESKNKYLLKQDYTNAAKLKNKEKELTTKINNLELKKTKKNKKIIKLSDVELVVSNKSKIPIYEINGVDNKYINTMEKNLKKEIVGQDAAISELINITKRFKLGYKEDTKPISLLFVGPTGVGKTKLATIYSSCMFGKNKIIRIDGSEYKDATSINKILGSAPGYVGYDDNNNKLEEVRSNPYSLILFDEIEKAHPTVLNLFLQILDDGKITDNKGNIIHFNNCVIIMTSNLGFNKEDLGFMKNNSSADLKDFLSIELLNRINKVIYFNKLNKVDIRNIINSRISNIKAKFKDKNIKIHIDNIIIDDMIIKSEYETFGARRIDKLLDEVIDNYVIDNILCGRNEVYINN